MYKEKWVLTQNMYKNKLVPTHKKMYKEAGSHSEISTEKLVLTQKCVQKLVPNQKYVKKS